MSAVALSGLTSLQSRNDDGSHKFQTMYRPEAASESDVMRPSPIFNAEFAKASVRIVAFALATLPLIACLALLMTKFIY